MINREPAVEELLSLWKACADFIEKHKISCPESIWQSDNVIIAAPELVEAACEHVGYYEEESDGL